MWVYIIAFVIGFVILIKGADLLVDGASSIAFRFGISQVVIGLTIVSFGTSAPEFLVNVTAGLNDASDLALGNIIGSNIANTFLILGIAALITPLSIKTPTIHREIPFCFMASLILIALLNDVFIDSESKNVLSHIDGIVLLAFFGLFVYYVFTISKDNPEDGEEAISMGMTKTIIYITLGSAGLIFGSKLVVDGAVKIATSFGISQAVIGSTIVAIGTSLPELTASAVAAKKGNSDIAIGNVVGSNVFNILWILGASASIKALPVPENILVDLAALAGSTFFLFIFLYIGKRHTLQRSQGAIFVILYAGYLVYQTLKAKKL